MSGVLVTAQEENLSSITKRNGEYSIPDIAPGSYTLIAQKPGCLVEIHSDVVVGGDDVVINFQLIPGDLKIDNQINLLDRIMLTSVWQAKEGDPNWNGMMDIYEDNIIDEKDRDLLLSHWRKGNPSIKLGSLEVLSEPEGADISINGADTGKTTPYIFPGMVEGRYIITLNIDDYAPGKIVAQVKSEEMATVDLILDDQPPEFVNWTQDPPDLTEDERGRFRIMVQVIDKGGSGLEGKIPQVKYRIGAETTYSSYEDMTSGDGDLWFFDIPEPAETWNTYRGKYIYYKVKAEDVAENEDESEEQSEEIDDINDSPTVRITSIFNVWERGLLVVAADAADVDGTISGVLFEYSLDNAAWTRIGSTDTTAPYSVQWDTTQAVREVAENVWIRATSTDDDSKAESNTTASFSIDNQAPVTNHDYDDAWHRQDITINLEADDSNGIGVASISYILNHGTKQDVLINGQTSAPVRITTESHANILEYWSVDSLGNEGSHKTLSNIKLDKSAPVFADWQKTPDDLTEDSIGNFRISVSVSDEDGSGLEGKIPQIDYHIGQNTQYDGYENMVTEDGKIWNSDILEPADTWNAHRNESIFYIVKTEDIAGNSGQSIERSERIDDINDSPLVNITSTFSIWESGSIIMGAEASDTDGTIAEVQFEYSSDEATWIPIGSAIATPPYTVEWDTTSITQAQQVWIQATATDDGDASISNKYPTSIGIDNQAPVTVYEYDGQWHTSDFSVTLSVSDGNGIGVSDANIKYKLNGGNERNLGTDGQPWITTEGENQLEYWSVDDMGNEETHHTLRNIKLDKTAPVFADWVQFPLNLTEDSSGPLQVSVRIVDEGGSDLADKPQFSYRIGRNSQYNPFDDMTEGGAGSVWYYDIPEPGGSWNDHRGEEIYYKVKAHDAAGNEDESLEQKELIEDINDFPTVQITTQFALWANGSITIDAESSDPDGTVVAVKFEYSPNRVIWANIGTVTAAPYSITWDTATSIPEVERDIWIRATTTDDDGHSVEYVTQNSMGIDNQPPVTTNNYNGLWHNEDFRINLSPGDGNGVGIDKVLYRFNYGVTQEIDMAGQISAVIEMTTEGADNVLEYWSIDKLGNEGIHQTLTDIKLDKTPPVFSELQQNPEDLTEDSEGAFRISVLATDEGGSGLQGKIPQIDYHIGQETQYDGYENMISGSWHFDISEPTETWNSLQNRDIHYKLRIEDIAGNVTETSPELTELIDSLNDAPVIEITSTFPEWVGEELTITATASDEDESIPNVQFEYSLNNVDWSSAGVADPVPPVFTVNWNTKTAIPEIEGMVWIRATATDADDPSVSVESITTKSFGVDNQPPVFGDWTHIPADLTEDTEGSFRVQVTVDDGLGSGIEKIEVSYRIGNRIIRSFRQMTKGAGNSWYFDIPEPSDWDTYRSETLFFNGRATDAVGNEMVEIVEQQELIDDINDPPRGVITSTFRTWESGTVTIMANVTDDDGTVAGVQFQYSTDNVTWINIGGMLTSTYTTSWDTTTIVMDPDVWLQAVVTDNNGASEQVPYTRSIGIDNIAPTFSNWRHTELTEDSTETFFRVEVDIVDQGSGVNDSQVQLDYRIGTSGYVGYRNMIPVIGSNTRFYEVPRPSPWNNLAGSTLFYKVRAADMADNMAESAEQREDIEATTGSISGTISPRETWLNRNATVTAEPTNMNLSPVSGQISLQDGSYTIPGLRPGTYGLVVTALGYGTDTSITNVQVVAGQDSPNHNVELRTYTVVDITRSQGGDVEFSDAQLNEYTLNIGGNALGQDGKVVIGLSGKEPTNVPNLTVTVLSSIGIGYEGRGLNDSIQIVMPLPSQSIDENAVLGFIYDGKDQSYRFITIDDINLITKTVTMTIAPEDVWSFSDNTHDFDDELSRTSDTVFYVLVTEFDEPQLSSSSLGVLRPQISGGNVVGYSQPDIDTSDLTIALVIHGITSTPSDMADIIGDLQLLKSGTEPYYDKVLVFNYEPDKSIDYNGGLLETRLSSALPTSFAGKVDVIAHGMGGLVARSAIVDGADDDIGSLVMLGVPHGGIDEALLKGGFADFLMKPQSNAIWSYNRTGWSDMLTDSAFLASLNGQSARPVDTHYNGIAASNPAAATDNDGLAYMASMDFTSGFLSMETPLTEIFAAIEVIPPASEGLGFMSRTRHIAMLSSVDVRDRVTEYLLGNSQNIQYQKYEGDLIPGDMLETFIVELKNVSDTVTVSGITAQLSTKNSDIRTFFDVQGIEKDTDTLGDIAPGDTANAEFSFRVRDGASFGDNVTFELLITNSTDNSISRQEFEASIGGDMIKIDLAADETTKLVTVNVDDSNPDRPTNDGDSAAEPGEVMSIGMTLENMSTATISNVTATLKSEDTRVEGLNASGQVVDLVNTGIEVAYGTFFTTPKTENFQFVRIKDSFTPLLDQVHFIIELKSDGVFIGTDEFDVKIGSDIVVDRVDIDSDLKPGGTPENISIRVTNVSPANIEDVRLDIDPSDSDVDIDDDSVRFDIGSGDSEDTDFLTEIDADFAGYVTFTLEIKVDGVLINVDTFREYFGGRTQYAANWIVDDDNGNDREREGNDIADSGESVKFQVAVRNLTDGEAEDVDATLDTDDVAIRMDEKDGRYRDIPAHEAVESRDEYEFTVGNAGDMSINAPSDSNVDADTFELPGANWIPDALVGGTLNPNTDQDETFEIIDNTTDTITVDTDGVDMTTLAGDDDPFEIVVEGAPFNKFEQEGYVVEFNFDITEDNDPAAQTTISFKVGGMIRYISPNSYNALMNTVSDAVNLDPTNNDGDGILEIGETIEVEIPLTNIWSDDIESIEARLDTNDDVDVIDDGWINYGEIRDGNATTKKFKFQIENNFEGSWITFTLEIEGDVPDADNNNLGTETFTIPVGQ